MLLARLIKEGTLTISSSVKNPQELLDILQLVDLSIYNERKGWIAEGDKNKILIRPRRGSTQITPKPNSHYPVRGAFDKEMFLNYADVSIDDLILLEEISVAEDKDKTQVEYQVLMHENARKNPRLTIRSYNPAE